MSDSCSDESDEFDSSDSSERSEDGTLSTLGAPARGPLLFCYAGLAVPVRLHGLARAEGPHYNVRSLVMQVAQQSPRYNPSALDERMQRLREQESDIEFKMLDSGGDEEEHLAAQDLCSLLRAGRIRGWRHLPTLAGRDAKLFGPKAGYKQCAAALADHALGVWPKIAQDIQRPFEARLPRSRYTMLTLASWFDSAEKGEQTMVLARFIRSAFKKESTGTALMRLIGLLVRDPNTYDDEGRTVWSQPTKNLVEGERQPMTKDEALEMADSVLVDAEVVDALVELSAERPRVLSAVNDEFRAEGYTWSMRRCTKSWRRSELT
jgi:hypothetical protein